MITLDFSRINAEIAAQEAKLAQMRKFLQVRTQSLAAALPAIVAFLEKHYAENCKFGNMYSAGGSHTEYQDHIGLIVNVEGKLNKSVKNTSLHIGKFTMAWEADILTTYNIGIMHVYITEGILKFQLYVK